MSTQFQHSGQFEFHPTNESFETLKQQLGQEGGWDAVLSETAAIDSVRQITIYSQDKQSWVNRT